MRVDVPALLERATRPRDPSVVPLSAAQRNWGAAGVELWRARVPTQP